jgi:hypothetical protein
MAARLFAAVAVLLLLGAHYRPTAHCARVFGVACKNWRIGAWLPTFGDSNNAWLEGHAALVRVRDEFAANPDSGTFFVYGNAGPPRGHVIYDPRRKIAFYEQGCCSWHDVVAASGVRPPPVPVATADLSALHTVRGVRLGMLPSDVMRIYGRAKFAPMHTHVNLKLLAYTTLPPANTVVKLSTRCGQFQNFYFRARRLVLIQLGNGC